MCYPFCFVTFPKITILKYQSSQPDMHHVGFCRNANVGSWLLLVMEKMETADAF
jgi:hypothetical protein